MSRKNVINLREWLKRARKNNSYTQQQLSELLGISQNYYSDIEMCKTQKNIDLLFAVRISDILDISIDYIIKEEIKLKNEELPESVKVD